MGADANMGDKGGKTALHWGTLFGNKIPCVVILSGHFMEFQFKIQNCHHCRLRLGHMEMVKMLLKNNVEVNIQDKEGHTALHSAVNKSKFLSLFC